MAATHSSPPATTATPASWVEDPSGRYELRWWDGSAWTANVSQGGEQLVDPLGTATTPEPPPDQGSASVPDPRILESTRRKPGGRALPWGTFIALAGLVLAIIGNAVGGDDPTRDESLRSGLMMGIGGWLIIAGVITLIVGFVGRSRAS